MFDRIFLDCKDMHTFPDCSSAFFCCFARLLRVVTARDVVMAINGTTPRNSRLSTQEYANAMVSAISMPIDISIRVPSRLPVAFVKEKHV